MIEYFNDKQQAMDWKDDRFYRPAKFNGGDILAKQQKRDELTEKIEEATTNAFNDGFFVGAGLMVALGLFVWSVVLLFN